jgi:hypothetical protein
VVALLTELIGCLESSFLLLVRHGCPFPGCLVATLGTSQEWLLESECLPELVEGVA